jgi:hypothetical protein
MTDALAILLFSAACLWLPLPDDSILGRLADAWGQDLHRYLCRWLGRPERTKEYQDGFKAGRRAATRELYLRIAATTDHLDARIQALKAWLLHAQ